MPEAPETTPAVEAAPAGETAPVTEPVQAAPEADPFDNAEVQSFDRAYVEKLRNEAAEKRVALKTFNEAFDGYNDAERDFFMDVIRGLKDEGGRDAAARRALEVFKSLVEPETDPSPLSGGDPEEDEEDRPLTIKEWKALQEKQQAEAAETEAVEAVKREAGELGYTVGTREYRRLMDVAVHETKGDLKKAHEVLEAERNTFIEEYLSKKKEAAEQTLSSPGGAGTPPSQERKSLTLEDARKAMLARLQAS